MTVWMDFNPFRYVYNNIDYAVMVSDDIIFAFVPTGGHFMISVNLRFKDFKHTFPLYMRLYNLSGILLLEGEQSEAM